MNKGRKHGRKERWGMGVTTEGKKEGGKEGWEEERRKEE